MSIRVLVCGGRDWDDELAVETVLNHLHLLFNISVVIHGAAAGADLMGMQWANRHGVKHAPFPANWKLHKLSAGPKRNRKMFKEGNPDLIVAFPGGTGTQDMVKVATGKKPVLRYAGWTCEVNADIENRLVSCHIL